MAKFDNLKDYLLSKHEKTIRRKIEVLLEDNYYEYEDYVELRNVIVTSVDCCRNYKKSYDLAIELDVVADVFDNRNNKKLGTISLKVPMVGNLSLDSESIRVNKDNNKFKGNPYYFDEEDPKKLSKRMFHIIEEIKRNEEKSLRDKKELCLLINNNKDTFAKAFEYILTEFRENKLTNEELAHWIGCSLKTVQNYRNGISKPKKIETVMRICLACELGPLVSKFLIEKTVGGIPDEGNKRAAYELLLHHTGVDILYWNMIMDQFDGTLL